jgi:hypothetical protein
VPTPLLTLLLVAAVLPTNPSPKPGELGAFYFDVMDQSEVWVNVEPSGTEPPPVILNATVRFPTRQLRRAPDRVTIRATAKGNVFPLQLRQPILRLRTADGIEHDLTGPGRVYQYTSSCEECPRDTIIADVTFDEFLEILDSNDVSMNGLGFALHLESSHLAALRRLAVAVEHGVTVK